MATRGVALGRGVLERCLKRKEQQQQQQAGRRAPKLHAGTHVWGPDAHVSRCGVLQCDTLIHAHKQTLYVTHTRTPCLVFCFVTSYSCIIFYSDLKAEFLAQMFIFYSV